MKRRFGAWLKAEFDLSERTAYRMMQVAENLDEKLANLAEISPSALYALAAERAARRDPLAELRMVEEIDKGQEQGEVAGHGGDRKSKIKPRSSGVDPATFKDINIPTQRVAEWRKGAHAG